MTKFNAGMDDNTVGTNKEILYVSHIFTTLKDAQSSFGGGEMKKNIDTFMLYCAYLESAILDDETRAIVMVERVKEKERLKKENEMDPDTIQFHEGFVTIKYVFKYLNDSVLEFVHNDIVGQVGKDDDIDYKDLFEEDNDIKPDDNNGE